MAKEFQHTRNNHLVVGYDQMPFSLRQNGSQNWFAKMGHCERPTLDWKSECIQAAKEIRASTELPIVVCLSGGIDSEVVAESFRQANIKFEAAILRFKKDYNIHDISWAIIYCEKYHISYRIYEMELEDFFNGEALEISRIGQVPIPFLCVQIKLIQLIQQNGGFPIAGTGEFSIKFDNKYWNFTESERMASFERYFYQVQGPGVFRFFRWNPEIVLSYLQSPVVKQILSRAGLHPQYNLTTMKLKTYLPHWALIERKKYFGGEKIPTLHAEILQKLSSQFPACVQEQKWNYAELVSLLTAKANLLAT